ncbi:hypothetical protein LN451_09570 [Xanthomonas hortorum pv. gardneri]|nr:hypothetical protein [Xanthomonas hortorum]MCC8494163.1 hypothetical protein [Xanthomonas hortorum pv. gardneri]MCE4528703.1 hypothetical protein [Xanthomonas hortorum pv. vitians]
MFVFTRRAIQQMLYGIAPWMPAIPLAELVSRLNTPYTNRLPQMWEVAWLYALGSVVKIEHERPLPGGKPDLWFNVRSNGSDVQVIADITTLSDTTLHELNPFEKLSEAVHKQARKAGLEGGGFHIRAEHFESIIKDGKKVQLLIPTGPAFEQLVKKQIKPFANKVATDPLRPQRLDIDESGAKFTVDYKGPSEYSQGSHRSYNVTLSPKKNVLYNRLNDKTSQLRGAPDGAVRMLVICDGDCTLLRENRPLEGLNSQHIVQSFLQGSQTIDIVLLVTVLDNGRTIFQRRDPMRVECRMVAAPTRPVHLTDEVLLSIKRVFDEAIKELPTPNMMPHNALRRNLDSEWSRSMEGGISINQIRIKVSARAVLELLAGVMTHERFAELHRFSQGELNIFASRLASGQLISSAKVERLGSDNDDDWLEFEFAPPDPAVSKFIISPT